MKKMAPWRIALTATAVVVLGVAGLGVVAAADPTAAPELTPAQRVERFLDRLRERIGDERFNALKERVGQQRIDELKKRAEERLEGRAGGGQALGRGLPHIGRNVIHAVVTIDSVTEGVITIQVDHGTVDAIGSGTLTIAEKGGSRQTLTTNPDTVVTRNGAKAALTDLAVGDTVHAVSRLSGDTATAIRIFAPRPRSG